MLLFSSRGSNNENERFAFYVYDCETYAFVIPVNNKILSLNQKLKNM